MTEKHPQTDVQKGGRKPPAERRALARVRAAAAVKHDDRFPGVIALRSINDNA